MRRTQKFPGLDAEEHQFEDVFGPLDSDTRSVYNLCGLDQLVGEGVIELPDGSRDPLDLLLEDRADALDEPDVTRVAMLGAFSRRSHDDRGLTWFAPGYAPRADKSLRRKPSIRLDRAIESSSEHSIVALAHSR
jgi:hypothetical protein